MLSILRRLFSPPREGAPCATTCIDAIQVAIWNLDPEQNDFAGRSWDGAQTYFCPKCQKFRAEVDYGDIDQKTGRRRYSDEGQLVRVSRHFLDGTSVAHDRSQWTPADQFREQFKLQQAA